MTPELPNQTVGQQADAEAFEEAWQAHLQSVYAGLGDVTIPSSEAWSTRLARTMFLAGKEYGLELLGEPVCQEPCCKDRDEA